jgi:radical SAM superfamily enzyme YgiQ (UPF0313 family)
MVGARVRYRDPEKVVEEMEYLRGLNFQQINIVDDLFTASQDHCLAVCDEIRRRELKARWTSFSRVDTISQELLMEMKKAGCYAVSFGVETGNPDMLKTIKKKISLERVVEAANLCRDVGVEAHFTFILGLPGETPETLRQTMDFSEKLKNIGGSCGHHLLAPFPGTEVQEKSAEFGLNILTQDWSEYHANRAVVETPSVSKEMLDDVVITWEKEYLDRLGKIKRRREKGEASEAEAWELTQLEQVVVINALMMSKAIEKKGAWPTQGALSAEASLNRLVDRVWESTDSGRDQVRKTLARAVGQGNLIHSEQGGMTRWSWLDYLE